MIHTIIYYYSYITIGVILPKIVTNNPNIGRNNAIMAAQVTQFTDKDLRDMAAYMASLPGNLVMKK